MLNRLNAQMQTANFTGISFFIKALSIQQVILCMLFGIWVATKHQTKGKPQELLSVHWSTARPDVATSQFVYSVIQEAAPQDMAQSCSQLSDTHDQQWCVMSKMPVSYTHPNRAESLWPGESCNEPFLLLVLVMLHAQFALLYTWVSPASKMLYNLRMFLIVGVQSTLVALTVVSLWGWNVGFSSAFLCTAAIVLSFALVWDILYQERVDTGESTNRFDLLRWKLDESNDAGVCVMEYAISTEQTYNLHLVRNICTMPTMVLLLLMKLSPFEIDQMYIVPIFSSVLLCYAQILLERKLLVRESEKQTPHSLANFKTEKIAYLFAGLLFAAVFMLSFANEAFFTAWKNAHNERSSYADVYMTYLITKSVELGIGFILYAIDDTMTYQRAIPDRAQIVADWSNLRYLVFTLTDAVVMLWLVIRFLFY